MPQIAENSEVHLANQALALLRASRITSIDDENTVSAKEVKLWFADVRTALLRSYEWNFAKVYLDLGGADGGVTKWQYSTPLPQNCLKALEIIGLGSDDWEVFNRRIGFNVDPPVKLAYIRDVPDVGDWDTLFRRVFVIDLASACAPKLAQDERIQDKLTQARTAAWEVATPTDASEGVAERADDFDFEFVRARYFGCQ